MSSDPRRSATDPLVGRVVAEAALRVAVIGAGGTGKTGLLAAAAEALQHAGRGAVRLAGRRGARPSGAGTALPARGDLPAGGVIVIDDAAWLDEALLDEVAGWAETGAAVVIACRPGSMPVAVARLVELAAGGGAVVRLGPLDEEELAGGIAARLGAPPDAALVDAVARATGSNPLLVDALVRGWQSEGLLQRGRLVGDPAHVPGLVLDLLDARLGQLDPEARLVLAALISSDDATLAEELAARRPEGWAALEHAGVALPGVGAVPVVAAAARRALAASERGAGQALAAETLAAVGAPRHRLAAHLWAARSGGPAAAATYLAAGDELVAVDPETAARWYERAAALLPGRSDVVGRRAAALAVADDPAAARAAADDALRLDPAEPSATAVTAAVYAARGLWADAAARYDAVTGHPHQPDSLWRAQGALCRLIGGDPAGGTIDRATLDGRASTAAAELSEKAVVALAASMGSAPDEVSRAREALSDLASMAAVASTPPEAPPSAAEVGAFLALALGELRLAQHFLPVPPAPGLRRAARAALRTWVDVRLGEQARPNRVGADEVNLSVDAALSRRSGDVAAGAAVARRLVEARPTLRLDLAGFDAATELLVVAARFCPAEMTAELVSRLEALLGRMGSPPLWSARLRWSQVEAAVATGRPGDVVAPAEELGRLAGLAPALTPLARAAATWQDVLEGRPDPERLDAAVAGLRDAGLAWEAAHLAGQAAIRVEDASLAKSLLGRARSLRTGAGAGRDEAERSLTPAGLSEREVEVGRLVLDGLTHKDVGATLFISPKTVEHHVAHIRQKLGVSTRAEFLAALREDLGAGAQA